MTNKNNPSNSRTASPLYKCVVCNGASMPDSHRLRHLNSKAHKQVVKFFHHHMECKKTPGKKPETLTGNTLKNNDGRCHVCNNEQLPNDARIISTHLGSKTHAKNVEASYTAFQKSATLVPGLPPNTMPSKFADFFVLAH